MSEIQKGIDFSKYESTIDELKVFLQDTLGGVAIHSAIFFGSSTMGERYFQEGVSDIDVCAFTDEMKPENYASILNDVKAALPHATLDKAPVLINDQIADRIEFYLEFPDINIDMNIMPPGLPRLEIASETAAHDSLEILAGSFYQHGIPFIGDIPLKNEIGEKFLPFYDDTLRMQRLDTLMSRVQTNNRRALKTIDRGDANVIDDIYKSRSYFLKWLFIYNRTYPISLSKHLEQQFQDFLHLDPREIETLQFSSGGAMIDSTKEYINLTEQYATRFGNEGGNV